ncbi:hypothetical protein XdyCFBP7245_14375 [Xanthomonas dyei]|uniref:Uncharacterized protein n=1 Tax=Xanthomonas dyei TaxID=743699 RepID=A0A2S7C113_9XANT|nr:hypothetical protein XdyCFBP7245_14375 [Xanthomonas dyei]
MHSVLHAFRARADSTGDAGGCAVIGVGALTPTPAPRPGPRLRRGRSKARAPEARKPCLLAPQAGEGLHRSDRRASSQRQAGFAAAIT